MVNGPVERLVDTNLVFSETRAIGAIGLRYVTSAYCFPNEEEIADKGVIPDIVLVYPYLVRKYYLSVVCLWIRLFG